MDNHSEGNGGLGAVQPNVFSAGAPEPRRVINYLATVGLAGQLRCSAVRRWCSEPARLPIASLAPAQDPWKNRAATALPGRVRATPPPDLRLRQCQHQCLLPCLRLRLRRCPRRSPSWPRRFPRPCPCRRGRRFSLRSPSWFCLHPCCAARHSDPRCSRLDKSRSSPRPPLRPPPSRTLHASL